LNIVDALQDYQWKQLYLPAPLPTMS